MSSVVSIFVFHSDSFIFFIFFILLLSFPPELPYRLSVNVPPAVSPLFSFPSLFVFLVSPSSSSPFFPFFVSFDGFSDSPVLSPLVFLPIPFPSFPSLILSAPDRGHNDPSALISPLRAFRTCFVVHFMFHFILYLFSYFH